MQRFALNMVYQTDARLDGHQIRDLEMEKQQ